MTNTNTSPTVRERRERLGLTQRQVARESDVSITMLQNIEAGLIPKHGETLGRVLTALELAEARAIPTMLGGGGRTWA